MRTAIKKIKQAFGRETAHPLMDKDNVRDMIANLPFEASSALAELTRHFELINTTLLFQTEVMVDVVLMLDEAAQLPFRRYQRYFLGMPPQSDSVLNAEWQLGAAFLAAWSKALEKAFFLLQVGQDVPSRRSTALKPLLGIRALSTTSTALSWTRYRYGPCDVGLWGRIGKIYRAAEHFGFLTSPVAQHGSLSSQTTIYAEYVRAFACEVAPMETYSPIQVDVAEVFVGHIADQVSFSPISEVDSVYWIDLDEEMAPTRLAIMPEALTPGMRFFKPAQAHERLENWLHLLGRGKPLPNEIVMTVPSSPEVMKEVLQHLLQMFAPVPAQRSHRRHQVEDTAEVHVGFSAIVDGLSTRGLTLSKPEVWRLDNVSRGGFSALLQKGQGKRLGIGGLVALLPEGGTRWLLGISKRMRHLNELECQVGIEMISQDLRRVFIKGLSVHDESIRGCDVLLLSPPTRNALVTFVFPCEVEAHSYLWRLQFEEELFLAAVVAVEKMAKDFQFVTCRVTEG